MEKVELEQGSLEWHEHRAKYRNASEAPALMGTSAFMTKRQLKAEKNGEGKPFVGNVATDYGHKMEPIALIGAIAMLNVHLEAGVWVNGEYSASLDAYGVRPDGTTVKVEIKAPYQKERSKLWQSIQGDEIPASYYWQLVHQDMTVPTGESWFFVYIDEDTNHMLPFQMDQGDDVLLKEQWDLFEAWDPEPEFEVMDDEFEDMVKAHKHLLGLKKQMEIDIKALETGLKSISEKPVKGFGLTISTVERIGNVDYKAIPALEGLDLEQYRKPSTTYKKLTHAKTD